MPPTDDRKRDDVKADDEKQIEQLYHTGDQALMTADLAVLASILAEDYVQVDPAGTPQTKQTILDKLRTGAIRYSSIVSTGRTICIFGNTAVVHGSESDEVESAGRRFHAGYIYLDVLLKRDGRWKLVASQLAKPADQ
ncbi:MAG: nuclear transport factor 2 family protein [Terriglobales bacterium]